MRKIFWLGLVLFMGLLMVGCAGKTATSQATEAPSAENTEVSVPATEASSPTDVATEADAGAEAGASTIAPTEVVDCQPYNLLDEVLPAANPNLPPITEEGDHALGPKDAKLVILEYSDFQ